MALEQLVFLVFALLAIVTSLGLVIFKDPVHCALSLVFAFANIAGVYILLGAEFIAAIQVLVYSGAILVLFLFVMMLLQVRPGPSLNRLRFFQSGFGPVLGVAFLVEVVLVVLTSGFVLNGGNITKPNNTQAAKMQAGVEYSVSVNVIQAAGPLTIQGKADGIQPNTVGHTAALGKELYSTYLFPFEVASIILLIAAIGAIVIARRSLVSDEEEDHPKRRGISLGSVPAQGSLQAFEVERQTSQSQRRKEAKKRTVILKK
ncbi:MAG: NADH-quinone oxidoreductase subunit J [Chloroflexota bacterium]|nr:NADH-quinone oxidoreductase subunit J [Chloroflexota bacterium]